MGNSIAEIDKNLAVETNIEREGLVFKNALDKPFRIYGVYHDGKQYRRMPQDVADATNEGVGRLCRHTAGGRVRFTTDSPYIVIKAVLPHQTRFAHMALAGVAGFDLYVKENGRYMIKKTFIPPENFEDSYDGVHDFAEGAALRDITINFPLYNSVFDLYIGIKEGSTLKESPEYKYDKPIVYYGSSITQGGCASRPGSAYQATITRKYDVDHVNLGFSGSGKAEKPIVDYIAGLDMKVFVYDYDHNAPTVEYYRETHEPMFKAVREKNPELPIVIMTRPKSKYLLNDSDYERIEIARTTYENALRAGDENVWFIPGYELMDGVADDEGTVDLCHPTDLGFYAMAKRLSVELEKIFAKLDK